jgi:hypothetical protein
MILLELPRIVWHRCRCLPFWFGKCSFPFHRRGRNRWNDSLCSRLTRCRLLCEERCQPSSPLESCHFASLKRVAPKKGPLFFVVVSPVNSPFAMKSFRRATTLTLPVTCVLLGQQPVLAKQWPGRSEDLLTTMKKRAASRPVRTDQAGSRGLLHQLQRYRLGFVNGDHDLVFLREA